MVILPFITQPRKKCYWVASHIDVPECWISESFSANSLISQPKHVLTSLPAGVTAVLPANFASLDNHRLMQVQLLKLKWLLGFLGFSFSPSK